MTKENVKMYGEGVQGVQGAFRVSVSLSQYFSDERALVRVAVDGRWACVAALARYLRATFRLQGAFCLVSEGHLLPAAEPLAALLRDGEPVEVIPLEKDWQHCTEEEENSKDEDEPVSYVSKEKAISMEKVIKKKKKKKLKHEMLNSNLPQHSEGEQCQDMDNEADMTPCDVAINPPPLSEAGDTVPGEPFEDSLQQLKLKALALLGEVAGRGVVSGGRVTKRKRVRRRARRLDPAPVAPPLLVAAAPPRPLNNTHTRFEDCGKSGNTSEEGEAAAGGDWCGGGDGDTSACRNGLSDTAGAHGGAEGDGVAEANGSRGVQWGTGGEVVAGASGSAGVDGVAGVSGGAVLEYGAEGDGTAGGAAVLDMGVVLQNTPPPPRTHPRFVRALPAPAPSTH